MPIPPLAPQRPHPVTQHGQTRTDNFYWMRFRDYPAVLEYLLAENTYLDEVLGQGRILGRRFFLLPRPYEAGALDPTRSLHARLNCFGGLAEAGIGQLIVLDARHFDMYVDAVE